MQKMVEAFVPKEDNIYINLKSAQMEECIIYSDLQTPSRTTVCHKLTHSLSAAGGYLNSRQNTKKWSKQFLNSRENINSLRNNYGRGNCRREKKN